MIVLLFLGNQSLINGLMWNSTCLKGSFYGNQKLEIRAKDVNGDIKGSGEPNLFLGTLIHDVEVPNGEIKECSANLIAKKMHVQAHDDGHDTQILDAIVDCRKYSNAFDKAEMHLRTKS